jgi:hypothetical protein
METLGNDFVAKSGNKVAKNYYCEKCDYKCSKLYNWNKHINTAKHNQEIIGNDFVAESGKKVAKKYSCQKCEKYFHTNAGLWKHNNKCLGVEKQNNNEISQDTILSILKQNSELQHMLIEQNKTIIELSKNNSITYSNNNNNSNNKTFNLQFFLNETCKDAMNIMDFIDSIKLQLSDLERVGELGYVEGISKIIINNLKDLDITLRPVHCTDKKRETIYVKDEDKWEKDEDKNKIRKAIKRAALKNARLIQKFKEKHPDYMEYHSKYSTQYHKLIIESFGGSGDNDTEKEDKIIRNISKTIVVDK